MANSGSSAGLALASQRHLFEIPDDVAFLNCAYISPLPKVSLSAGDRGLRRKAQPWTIAAADFFTSSSPERLVGSQLPPITDELRDGAEIVCRPHQRRHGRCRI